MRKNIKYLSLGVVLVVGLFLISGCDSNTSKYENTAKEETNSNKIDSFKDNNENKTEEEESLKEKTIVCTREATIADGIKADLRYEVNYKGKYVTYLKSTEKIISDNIAYLNAYKTQIESTYEPYKNVEYYNYEVVVDGDTMTSSVNVDYSKIDTNELISIDSANSTLIKNGKVNIEDIKTLYESVGTICN